MKDAIGAIPSHLMTEPTSSVKAKNVMGKDDFMKLLMVQLRNQDPLKPMDHKDMSAQLAQFGQLEQLNNIGAGIKDLRSGVGEGSRLQALGLIGKRVQALGDQVELVSGQSAVIQSALKPGMKPVKVSIHDGMGIQVRELDLTNQEATESITWDGKSSSGAQLPSGKYTFRVRGVDANGQSQDVGTELSGRVTGMEMEGQVPMLLVETASGSARVELGRVKQVTVDQEGAVKSGKPAQIPVPESIAKEEARPEAPATAVEASLEPEPEPDEGPFGSSMFDNLSRMERVL